jgi:CDP-2,3-bis-(O-geranylgeranyl)-sn-glycerol synthase
MKDLIFQTLWFLMPASVANMAPVLAARIFPTWNTPIDLGFTFRNIRVFGDHKTIRGLVAGTIAGGLIFILQAALLDRNPLLNAFAYPGFAAVPVWFGFWQGFCALVGDMTKSFFKRRLGIRPGASWIPFDQIDWTIATLLGSFAFVHISVFQSLAAIFLAFVLSLSAHRLGYLLKLNSDPS